MKNYLLYIFSLTLVIISACNKEDLEPSLVMEKTVETSINSLEDMQGLALGMYNRLTSSAYYGRNYIIYGEVRSDNCFVNGNTGRFLSVGKMMVDPDEVWPTESWADMYATIASANILIQQNPVQIEGDKMKIKHIIGQAYVVRALVHFDLLKLFGQQHAGGSLGIPYVTSYKGENMAPARETVAANRTSIFSDIDAGLELMSESLNDVSKEFITTYAGYALKARVALYFGDWEAAKTAAQKVVDSGNFSIVPPADFVNSWKTDGAENSIFELAFSSEDNNDGSGLQDIFRGEVLADVEVLQNLRTIFDEGDVRNSAAMIDTISEKGQLRIRNFGKYPSADYSDNISLIRYEEVVLTLAEAKIELGESGALEILNEVPEKRNANLYTEATKANVLKERRREFCFEGFRFDDLARTGSDIPLVDSLKQTHGGPEYGSYNFAFPIPSAELNANPNMEQNSGY